MKTKSRLALSVFVLFFLLVFFLSPSTQAEGYLHTRGQDMVDDAGNVVLLRGVGLGNWLLPEGYMWKFGKEGDRPRKIEALVEAMIGPEAAEQFWLDFRRNYITEADICGLKMQPSICWKMPILLTMPFSVTSMPHPAR
ncbi:MAG: hypothetical protein H8E62_11910 [Planctomycetes bacterium]|nr:hypothetical protein [Planctomycetota bacterium]